MKRAECHGRRAARGPAAGRMQVSRLSIVVALAFVVAACAPSTGGTSPSGAPSASGGPVRGGTLVFAIWQEPVALAPPLRNQTVANLVARPVTEGLSRTDTDGNHQPRLAKQIPTQTNGGLKLTA